MASHLAVKGFATFQHYHNRNPPWIKLYGTILSDVAFLQLPEAAQAQLVKLWVLASQFGHPLPNEPRLLAGRIGTKGQFHLAALIEAGFLIPCEQNASSVASNGASKPLAESGQNASSTPARTRVRARAESGERRAREERPLKPTSGSVASEKQPASLRSNAEQQPRSALGPHTQRFLDRRYPVRGTRRSDVERQLQALTAGETVPFNGGRISAYGVDRLERLCAELDDVRLRDEDKAIVVLLRKLTDTTDVSADLVQDERERLADDERIGAERRALVDTWEREHPHEAEELHQQVLIDYPGLSDLFDRVRDAVFVSMVMQRHLEPTTPREGP